jgi:hypothetical protein
MLTGQLTRGVDHKNDRFVDNVTIVSPGSEPMIDLSTPMAEYAFWLQHEYFRSRNRPTNLAKDGWYERRMSWFRELMDIMQVRDSEIVKGLRKIDVTESRSEQVDQEAISAQFLAHFKSSAFEIVDLNTQR